MILPTTKRTEKSKHERKKVGDSEKYLIIDKMRVDEQNMKAMAI